MLVFRSAGKSTLVGIFCAWLLAQDPDLRILVLAAEHDLARKMVRNVKRIIERHPLTSDLMPSRADQWAADQFTVRRPLTQRDPSLLARGITANVTGSRADVVICDDVEVPNTCDTPGKREQLRERLAEISYVLVPGGLQLYVGTPHSYYSIYAEDTREESGEARPFLGGFVRLCIPILDSQGRSRWPERFSAEKIEEIRRHTGPAKFDSQMMLQPRSIEEVRLDPARLVTLRRAAGLPGGQPRGGALDRRAAHGLGDGVVGPGLWLARHGRRQRGRGGVRRRRGRLLAARHPLSEPRSGAAPGDRRSDPAVPAGGRVRRGDATAGDRDRDQRPRPVPARPATP